RAYAVAGMIGYADYNSGKTQTFEGIKVIDEKKISFTFEVASPANIECFSYGILSKAHYVFTTWEELIAYNEKPLGTGIMKLDSWAAKQFIKVVKNDAYWDKANAAKIDGVMMLEVSDDALLPALQTGEIDFAMPAAKADTVKALGEMKGVTTQKYIGNGYTFMCFNTLNPILSDVRVRQALMYGLDRASFIEAEYGSKDLAEVGLAPMSPTSWAFPDKSELNAYAFDLEKAGKLLDEAGWKLNADGKREKDGKPFEISWLVYTDSTWPGTLAGMAFDSWGKLGIKLNVEQMDFDTVASRTMDAKPGEKDFDIYTMGFQLSVDPDPTGALFDADAFVEGGFNASGFRDDKSQELIANGKKEFDTEKRAAIYKEWCKLQNELIPHVIIAYRNEIWGVNNRVKGMELGTYSDWVTQLGKITLEAPAK
ncbi:MAG: ABC transporter substrate-binding protein, partial [Oscillospiraceae bacterium]